MPVDVESELARLGEAWTALVAHVDVAEVLERTMTTRFEPRTVDEFDVMAEQPARRRWTVLAVAAVVVLLVAATVAGLAWENRTNEPSSPTPTATAIANGWIAFAGSGSDDVGTGDDIYLVREGSNPRRITGSDTDLTDEICPAFSPDGTRLAFGQATGNSEDGYSGDGALVITDLSADGVRTAATMIALEGAPHPPCAIWSADGRWVAFGVETPAGGSDAEPDQVWVVDTDSDDIRRLTGLSATDLDWAPHAAELAIASDGIALYSVTADELHSLGDAQDVGSIAWSPDGQTIAVMRRPGDVSVATGVLRLMDADGTDERVLVPSIGASHGLGPVWSPDGERIAYQRRCGRNPSPITAICNEETEVVLLTVNEDDPLEPAGTQVVIPPPQTNAPDGQPLWWYPFGVTWSPDGTALLYHAWAEASDLTITQATPTAIVALSLDGETPPVVLSGDLGADPYSAFPWLPIQSWGRQQGG